MLRRVCPGRCLIILGVYLCALAVHADEQSRRPNSSQGYLDFNVYPYLSEVDSDSVFTLNISTSLHERFSYFSMSNFQNQEGERMVTETSAYYTEQNLRWKAGESSPIDLTYQGNLRSGEDNDRHRLGFRWRLHDTERLQPFFQTVHLNYSMNFHVLQYDDDVNNVWQLEHSFFMRFPWLSSRVYLSGFIDHTFNETLAEEYPNDPVVAEAQLGVRLFENLYAAMEYRYNEYRLDDETNLALGIEYKILW